MVTAEKSRATVALAQVICAVTAFVNNRISAKDQWQRYVESLETLRHISDILKSGLLRISLSSPLLSDSLHSTRNGLLESKHRRCQ